MPRPSNIQNANLIRRREVKQDSYYTPQSLVHIHLSKLATDKPLVILEPAYGNGAYFNLFPHYFPNSSHYYTEIKQGLDFFDYNGPNPDIIVTNPPFSLLDRFIEKMLSLRPLVISLLLNQYAVTPCRIRAINAHGYYLSDYHLTRVDRWFGVSCIIVLRRDIDTNIISFDCTKHILETPTHITVTPEYYAQITSQEN
jgi:hypothetical protein